MTRLTFSRPKRWVLWSWLIQKVTRSRASHVLIRTPVLGCDCFIHATVGGVKITPAARYMRGREVVAEFRIMRKLDSGITHAMSHVGARYDYAGILGFLWVVLAWRLFRKRIKNPLASPTGVVCSEFVLELNHGKQIPEWLGLDPERTHPQHLLEIAERGGSFVRV